MTEVERDEHGRPQMPVAGAEVETLLGFLDFLRATVEWKCRGLDDQQLRATHPPTVITLGGLLMHLARVEDYWFGEVVAEQPKLAPWDDMEWAHEWSAAAAHSGDELRGLWAHRVEHSRQVVAARLAAGVEATYSAWDGQGRVSLRWVLVHMIEEYARHSGHADLLREAIDGETGE